MQKKLYQDLLQYHDDKVKFEAATSCLKLNENIKQAKSVLKYISKNNSNPSIGFAAEMTLQVYKEEGKL